MSVIVAEKGVRTALFREANGHWGRGGHTAMGKGGGGMQEGGLRCHHQ